MNRVQASILKVDGRRDDALEMNPFGLDKLEESELANILRWIVHAVDLHRKVFSICCLHNETVSRSECRRDGKGIYESYFMHEVVPLFRELSLKVTSFSG